VIEGIEDEFEATLALESGADFGQGYYLGRPALMPELQLASTAWRFESA